MNICAYVHQKCYTRIGKEFAFSVFMSATSHYKESVWNAKQRLNSGELLCLQDVSHSSPCKFERTATLAATLNLSTAYLVAGYDVVLEAFESIREGEVFSEDLLMSIATIGALIIGFVPNGSPMFPEAVIRYCFSSRLASCLKIWPRIGVAVRLPR